MYVCFGFSLARSRRARTIDLQCQSLSLRRAFLLRSVCLSCMSVSRSRARSRRERTVDLQCQSLSLRAFLLRIVCLSVRLIVESRAVCWPTRSQNRSKVTAKIETKINAWRRLGAPKIDSKSLLGPSRETPWRARASRRRLRSVPGASRSVPGALRECPKGRQGRPGTPEITPWSARERAEATKIDAKSRPGAEKSSFLRAAHSQSIVGAIFCRFLSIFTFSAKSANP